MTTTAEIGQAKDVKFLQELEKIFSHPFNAKIYPGANGEVEKARVNTDQEISGERLLSIIELAGSNKLNLTVARSGAGLKILFSKNKK
jgi:hypothetical protein